MSKPWMFTGVICGVPLWKFITTSFVFLVFYIQMVVFKPIRIIGDDLPIFLFVPLRHKTNSGFIARERLEMTIHSVVLEVRCVEVEKEGKEHCTLRGPRTA